MEIKLLNAKYIPEPELFDKKVIMKYMYLSILPFLFMRDFFAAD